MTCVVVAWLIFLLVIFAVPRQALFLLAALTNWYSPLPYFKKLGYWRCQWGIFKMKFLNGPDWPPPSEWTEKPFSNPLKFFDDFHRKQAHDDRSRATTFITSQPVARSLPRPAPWTPPSTAYLTCVTLNWIFLVDWEDIDTRTLKMILALPFSIASRKLNAPSRSLRRHFALALQCALQYETWPCLT